MRAATTALALLAILAISAGCGLSDPYNDPDAQAGEEAAGVPVGGEEEVPPEDSIAESDDHSIPTEEPEEVTASPGGRGGDSPGEVASLYARTLTNWSWRDVAEQNRTVLADLTAGDLRDAVRANARDLKADTTLERDEQSNRGEELALDVQGSDPRRRTVWVVLRETASAKGFSGLSDTRTTVYRATAERLDDGRWYVTAFEPES